MNNLVSKYDGVRINIRAFSIIFLLGLLMGLSGCKTTRKAVSALPEEDHYLSSKVQLTLPYQGDMLTVSGSMKLVKNERMQLSFWMPLLRTEMLRLEVTPDDVLLIDRMGKRYVQASRDELKTVLPKKADFANLEKTLFDASKPGGKNTLTAEELGLTAFAKAKVTFSDFSTGEFTLLPTQVSTKYTKVEWTELIEMLMKL